MGSFFYGLSMIFPRLLDHTLEISVLICLIFLVKLLAPKKLPPWWHYSLWLLLLVRMLVPLQFENRLNLLNFVPAVETPHVSELISAHSTEVQIPAQPVAHPTLVTEADIQFAVKRSIPVIWLTGAMIMGICVLFESLVFWRNVRRRPKVTDKAILALLSECKSRMKIKRKIAIVVTDNVRCPALFGYLRPRLLLPEGIFDKLSDRELSYAFLHELGHLKRHDIGVSWLIAILQVIHWFNPLVWLAFYQIRIDQESACDAAVLSRMKAKQSGDYAKAIVGFLEKFCQNCQLPALAGVLENRSQMRRRIARIVQYRKSSSMLSFVALTLLVPAGFLLFSLTGVAAQKGGASPSEPAVAMAGLEIPGNVTEGRPVGVENFAVEFRVALTESAQQMMQERDFSQAPQPEGPLVYVPETPIMTPQHETPAESPAVPKEDAQYAGPAKEMERTYVALAETSVTQPRKIREYERNVAPSSVEIERPASTSAAANLPASVDGSSAASSAPSVSRQTPTESAHVSMTALQEPASIDEPARSSLAKGESGAEQKIQARNDVDLAEESGSAYPVNNSYQIAKGDTMSEDSQRDLENNRQNRMISAAVTEMVENTAGEVNQDAFHDASMTAKREAVSSSGVFQAGDVDTPPRIKKYYPPHYPYRAKRDDITGSIIVQFVITTEGNAVDTTVVRSDPEGVFDEAALQAIEEYRFEPGLKDGKAVPVRVNLPIKFDLT